jgi:hypothetical protein
MGRLELRKKIPKRKQTHLHNRRKKKMTRRISVSEYAAGKCGNLNNAIRIANLQL